MDEDESTPPGDDTPPEGQPPQDAPASPPDPTPPEEQAAPVVIEEAEEASIDVIVMGPVLGAKKGSIIAVTPTVYADYKPFLRRIG